MIEDGLRSLALADAATNALISGRFYALNLPPTSGTTTPALPAVSYRVISTTEQYTNDGPIGLVQYRLQMDAYGASYADARAVSVALRALLNGYSGTLPNGCQVLSISRDGEQSGFDQYVRLPYVQTDWLILTAE